MPKPAFETDIITIARNAFSGNTTLLEQLAPLLDAAEQGDAAARDIFVKSVSQDGVVNYGQLLAVLAGFASKVHTGIDPTPPKAKTLPPRGEVKLPPHITRKQALKLADEIDFLRMMPADAEEAIFNEMPYARDERSDARSVRIIDEVRMHLAVRTGRALIKASDNVLEMGGNPVPPPAGDTYDDYCAAVMRLVDMEMDTLEAWLTWPHWKSVLAYQFVNLLMNVREIGHSHSNAKRMEDAIEFKSRWYRALGINGVEDADLVRAVNTLYDDTRTDHGIKAMAELARYVKPDDDSLREHPSAPRLLASAIAMVHHAAPFLRESRFLKLLPPYIYPMTVEGALELLSPDARRGEASTLFQAQAMLMMHTIPSQEQLGALARLVQEAGENFETFEDFCRSMLGFTPDQLSQKIADLEATGFHADEATNEIDRVFPGALPARNPFGEQVRGDLEHAEAGATISEDGSAAAAGAADASGQLALGAAATVAVAGAGIKPGGMGS